MNQDHHENDPPLHFSQGSAPRKNPTKFASSTAKPFYTPTPIIHHPTLSSNPALHSTHPTTPHDLNRLVKDLKTELTNEKRQKELARVQVANLKEELLAMNGDLKDKGAIIADLQSSLDTVSDMYEEASRTATKLWTQAQKDRQILEEFDHLTTDAVHENEVLRLWVIRLGGDPDSDAETWDALRAQVLDANLS